MMMDMNVCSKAVQWAALMLMLMPHVAVGCQCPSCHYTDAAQNCQCCVYRQLGKRSDTALNLDLSVPPILSLPRYPTANSAQSPSQFGNPRSPSSLASRDWSSGKMLRRPEASYSDVSYDVRSRDTTRAGVRRNDGFSSSLSEGMEETLSRVVNDIKLASALEVADVPQQDRPYEYRN